MKVINKLVFALLAAVGCGQQTYTYITQATKLVNKQTGQTVYHLTDNLCPGRSYYKSIPSIIGFILKSDAVMLAKDLFTNYQETNKNIESQLECLVKNACHSYVNKFLQIGPRCKLYGLTVENVDIRYDIAHTSSQYCKVTSLIYNNVGAICASVVTLCNNLLAQLNEQEIDSDIRRILCLKIEKIIKKQHCVIAQNAFSGFATYEEIGKTALFGFAPNSFDPEMDYTKIMPLAEQFRGKIMEELEELVDVQIVLKLSEHQNNEQKTFVICSTTRDTNSFEDMLCRTGFEKTILKLGEPMLESLPTTVQQNNIEQRERQEEIAIETRQPTLVVPQAPVNISQPTQSTLSSVWQWAKKKIW